MINDTQKERSMTRNQERNGYRGYEIKHEGHIASWRIYLGGQFVCAQPSEEFARHWVDKQTNAWPDWRSVK